MLFLVLCIEFLRSDEMLYLVLEEELMQGLKNFIWRLSEMSFLL